MNLPLTGYGEQQTQQLRMFQTLRRHVRANDKDLSDADQIEAVLKRYRADRAGCLVDPAE